MVWLKNNGLFEHSSCGLDMQLSSKLHILSPNLFYNRWRRKSSIVDISWWKVKRHNILLLWYFWIFFLCTRSTNGGGRLWCPHTMMCGRRWNMRYGGGNRSPKQMSPITTYYIPIHVMNIFHFSSLLLAIFVDNFNFLLSISTMSLCITCVVLIFGSFFPPPLLIFVFLFYLLKQVLLNLRVFFYCFEVVFSLNLSFVFWWVMKYSEI
jgi:hypothetical protein